MPSLPRLTLLSWQDLSSLLSRITHGTELRRACGCAIDPVVFGHQQCAEADHG